MTGKGMSVKQCAAWLGWTEKCLRGRIDRHLIPHRKLGRNLIFWQSELEEWRLTLPGCSIEEALENMRKRNGSND